jgi:hypothetical protein
MNYLVRIGNQTVGPMTREGVLRHAPKWQSGSLAVSVAPAGTQNFVPLAQFIAGAQTVNPSPAPAASFPPPPAFGQSQHQPSPAQPLPLSSQMPHQTRSQAPPHPQAPLPWQQPAASPTGSASKSRAPFVAFAIGGAAVVIVALLIIGGLLHQRKQGELARQMIAAQQQEEERQRQWLEEQQRKADEARQSEWQRQQEAARQAALQQQGEEERKQEEAARKEREQKEIDHLARVYARQIGQQIISQKYNDGINKSVVLKEYGYDKNGQSFRLQVALRWDGSIITSNQYEAEGEIIRQSNGSYEWNPTSVNDNVKKWQQAGRIRILQ